MRSAYVVLRIKYNRIILSLRACHGIQNLLSGLLLANVGMYVMSQIQEFRNSGNWLFMRRSFLPFFTVVIFLVALRDFAWPQDSHSLDKTWEIFCFAISWLGFGIRVFTVGYAPEGTSSRSTKRLKANVLNTKGMYSIVRHPLYLGNFLIWLGISIFLRSFLFSLACITIFFLYYERIIFAEEEFLREKFGEGFAKWASRTPMMLPNLKNWKKPNLSFSLKTVLRREYTAFFVITASFTALEILGDLFYRGKWEFEWTWAIMFFSGLLVYLTLRAMKKTGILEAKHRDSPDLEDKSCSSCPLLSQFSPFA